MYGEERVQRSVPRVGVTPRKIKGWGGGMGPASQNPWLFNTKICDFSYPIYDPTNNSIPYLRAGP